MIGSFTILQDALISIFYHYSISDSPTEAAANLNKLLKGPEISIDMIQKNNPLDHIPSSKKNI